jgi:hypothetical protein
LQRTYYEELAKFPFFLLNLVGIKPQLKKASKEMETLESGVLNIFKEKCYYTQ